MNGPRIRRGGFALMLVMLLVAVAAVLGVSYMSVASLKVASSDNYAAACRAKYLAESGLQHAMWVVQSNPTQLANTSSSAPLGPFYLDGTDDRYVFYGTADAQVPGRYVVTAQGVVGAVSQFASASVLRSGAPQLAVQKGFNVTNASTWLPSGLTINGDVQVNGQLVNFADINGKASATSGIMDVYNLISGTKNPAAAPQNPPDMSWSNYTQYQLFGATYTARPSQTITFTSTNKVNNGGEVTASNPGGVVWLQAATAGSSVTLKENINFTGTFVAQGNLIIDGANVKLTAVDGFPALAVGGSIVLTNNARLTINGTVIADGGIVAAADGAYSSRSTINGALMSKNSGGYDFYLNGTHVLNYTASRATVYDMTGNNGGKYSVTLQTWIK